VLSGRIPRRRPTRPGWVNIRRPLTRTSRAKDLQKQLAAIHQFHATAAWGDAIGNILFQNRNLFRQMGYRSEIFRIHAQEQVAEETYSVDTYRRWSSPDTLLLVHYSMGWESWPQFLRFKDRRILIYHNITPAEYFEGFSEEAVRYARKGREDLPGLAKYFSSAIADSSFNAAELRQAGFRNVVVIPPLVDLSQYRCAEQPTEVDPQASSTDWLFVGRIAPNKKQDEIIRAFSHYQRNIQPNSQLFLVGSDQGMELYGARLRNLVAELGLKNVFSPGKLGLPDLLDRYRRASVFVCLSEHEGFCIPLLEAMQVGLPIVAYAQPAVAETLQDSAILLEQKTPEAVAEAVENVLRDAELRNSLREKERIRLKDFEPAKVGQQIRSFLGDFGLRRMPARPKTPVRIACATLRYYPQIGGAEVVLQNVLERLAQDGFQCTVYATDAKSAEDIFLTSQGSETEEWINGVHVIRSPVTNPPKKAWLARNLDRISVYGHGAWSYRQFRHLLRDQYDVVHSSPFPSTHNYLAYAAARTRRKPFVCSPHLHLADSYHSDRWSLFAMMRGAAAVLANTSYERDHYVKRGVSPRKIYVTGVGCDVNARDGERETAPRCALDFPAYQEKRKVIFVGRKDPHKGISDILRALRLLTLGRKDILFTCVGPETGYSKELWQQIPPGLQEQLLVIDSVSEGEKHALIEDSDLLILMSTTESFGIVLLEAWLHGKAVIGARAGALQSVIQDGTDGLLVEPGNHTELAATIEFLLENPEISARLGANGRTKTVQQFSWDAVAEAWSRVFWQVSESR
jgi:L-malate glycosyltransferase